MALLDNARVGARASVREADACRVPGEVGALLRREGLYSSHLTHWRREVEAGENAALAPKPRGPKPDLAKAESRPVAALEREVARLRRKLERAEQIIDAVFNVVRSDVTTVSDNDEAVTRLKQAERSVTGVV